MSNKNFIVKHGLEVDGNLIYANPDTNRIGIKTSTPSVDLDIAGNVRANNLTLSSNLSLNGNLSIGGSSGAPGYYLANTGIGITWAPTPGLRTLLSVEATTNQSLFNVVYNVSTGVDVFINGTRLSSSDYTANNGSTVILNVPCFGGERVEIIAYSVFGTASPGITIQDNSIGVGTANVVNRLNFIGFSSIALSNDGYGVNITNSLGDLYDIEVKNQLRFYEDTDNCADYISIEAPSSLTTSTSYQLPSNFPPGNDYYLNTNTVGIMTWKQITAAAANSGFSSCGVGIGTTVSFRVILGIGSTSSSYKVLVEAVDDVTKDIELYEGFIVNTLNNSTFLTGFNVQAPTNQNFLTTPSTTYDGSNNLVLDIANVTTAGNNINVKVNVNPIVC